MKAILLNRILIVLGFIGIFLAGVLSLESYFKLAVPCGGSNDCATVAADKSSHLLGIENSYLGLIAYIVLTGLAIYRTRSLVTSWKKSTSLGYGLTAIGTLYSIGLQVYAHEKIHATCKWCLGSAATITVMLIVYALLMQDVDDQVMQAPKTDDVPEDRPELLRKPDFPMASVMAAVLGVLSLIGIFGMKASMEAGQKINLTPEQIAKANLVPKDAHIYGKPNSPLTIVEFADMCCPACQRYSPQVKHFVEGHPGQIRLVYRNFPLPMHPLGMTAAAIGECMADEGLFWDFMIGVMSLNRQPNDLDELLGIAKGLGADVNKIKKRLSDTNDPAYDRLTRDLDTVHALGIDTTPTFMVVVKGEVKQVVGPSEIMDTLNGDKYKSVMEGRG